MFDTIFQRRPHFGEKRVPVKFKLVIKDICFESNEYFMQNSTYSIFQSKNHHHKVKSKKSLFALADTKNIPIDETLKFHATLFEKNAKYSPKTRKIMIRQNTHLNGEDLYKDVGFVELPLDKIAHGSYSKDCKLELVDPERHMKAHINVTIKYKVSKKEDHAADRAEKGNIHATFSGAEWDFENEDEDVGDDVRVLDRNEYSLSGKNAPKNNSNNNGSNNNISAPRSNSNVNNSNIVVSRNNSGANVVANRTNSSSNNISASRNNSGLNNIAVNRANSGLNNASSHNKSAEPTGNTLQKQPSGRQLNNSSSSNAAAQLSTTTSSSPARQLVRVQSTADGVTVSPNTRGSGNNGRGYNAQSAVADQTVTPQHTSHTQQQLSSQHQHTTSLHNVSYVKHQNQHPQVPQLPLHQQEQQQYQPQQHRRGSNSPQTSPRLENQQQQQYAQQSPRLQYNPRGAAHQSAAAPSQQLTQSSLSSLNYSNYNQVAAPRNGSFSNNGYISQQEKTSSAVESLISIKKSNSSISLRSNSVKSVRFEDDPVMPSQGGSSRGKAVRMSEEDFFGVTYNEMEGF